MAAKKMHSLNMRLSAEDLEALRLKSEALGLTVSEYLRRCGLRRSLPKPRTLDRQHNATASEVADLMRQLSALVALAGDRSEVEALALKIVRLLPKSSNRVSP